MKSPFSKSFTESRFLGTVAERAGTMGCTVLCLAFRLFYALQNPALPKWAKRTIVGTLVYLISPIDAIPDLIPGLGYTDDLTALTAAALTLAAYVDAPVREKAHAAVKRVVGGCDCDGIPLDEPKNSG